MKSFGIRSKLIIISMSFAFVIILEGLISIYYINNMSNLFTGMYHDNLVPLNKVRSIERSLIELRLITYQYLGTYDPDRMEIIEQKIDRHSAGLDRTLAKEKDMDSLKVLFENYLRQNNQILDEHFEFNTSIAYEYLADNSLDLYQRMMAIATLMSDGKQRVAHNNLIRGEEVKRVTLLAMGSITILSTIVSFVIAFLFANNLTGPILRIRDNLHLLAKGELEHHLPKNIFERRDEFGAMAKDYEATQGALAKLIDNLGKAKEAAEVANHANSELGNGSVFNVVLKDVEVTSQESLNRRKKKNIDFDSILFEKNTVLICDDIEYNRLLLISLLEEYGFHIVEAENGREALEQIRQRAPDLILLDMKMPIMNGYELSEILSNDQKLSMIPVIAITASALKKDEQLIKQICDGYLRKPISRDDLLLEIMKYLPWKKGKESDQSEIAVEAIEKAFPVTPTAVSPELSSIMEGEFNSYEELCGAKVIDLNKVELFSVRMKEHGEKYRYQPLVDWAEDLCSATIAIDLETIKKPWLIFNG